MTNKNELSPFLRFSERYISDRQNVLPAVDFLRQNLELLAGIQAELDRAIAWLNELRGKKLSEMEKKLLPNASAVLDVLKEKSLSTTLELTTDIHAVRPGIKTYRQANELMKRGEEDGPEPKWSFHKDLADPEQLAIALAIEMYGKYIERVLPEVNNLEKRGFAVVLALEEMIALHRDSLTKLFAAVKNWYSEDEGFSRELIEELHL